MAKRIAAIVGLSSTLVRVSAQLEKNSSKKNNVAKFAGGVLLGLTVIIGGAYGADYFLNKDAVPRGAAVGGVEIGGLSHAEAIDVLSTSLHDVTSYPVTVAAGELRTQIVPADAGISIDYAATVAAAGEQPLNPITRITSFFSPYEVTPVVDTQQQQFADAINEAEAALTRQSSDGGIHLGGGEVVIDPQPVNGQTISRSELENTFLKQWLSTSSPAMRTNSAAEVNSDAAATKELKINASITTPALDEKALDKVAKGDAKQALSAPITVTGRDGVTGVIPVDRMGEVVTFVPEGDHFRTNVDPDRAQAILSETLSSTEVAKRNAQISFVGGGKSITPHADGVKIDWPVTLADFSHRVIGSGERTFDAVYIDEPATFTTEQAQTATFDEVVGEFTTSGYSAASGINIAKVAATVNGAIVAPGDTFSLNGYTGPRGVAQGYVESGVILNGRSDTAVGGGISQFATTLYNAAYFAGMEDVAHTAHSYYISRYPAGREATVYEGAIDLQFRNTSQYPVRIVASAGGGSVTVQLLGVKTVNVESINGGRWAYTSPRPITVSDANCTPSGGAQGFTTSDTRIIRNLSGAEISRETQTTVYNPQPIVRCS
ncbi:putative vancomycin resistance protein [Corynebacterium kutscheri]|uniref:Putative vancomycin resistance protein n=1 Tax=Corynebacterium kutscheri TaxID=35755 RepID=A0A0F6TEU5_9CORY|nr:putative vancomycin resistance protein [Corynebacterium kutscheri]VEH05985.1 putative secreted protein [Corynebacterium kutscheri]VEH10442.1 putative secreted protein [Corynebacterium kutscheri]